MKTRQAVCYPNTKQCVPLIHHSFCKPLMALKPLIPGTYVTVLLRSNPSILKVTALPQIMFEWERPSLSAARRNLSDSCFEYEL